MYIPIYIFPIVYVWCPQIFLCCTQPLKPDVKIDSAPLMRGKKSKNKKDKKYDAGITDVLNIIGCYNPKLLEELMKCNIPYETARKIVQKMINMSVEYPCTSIKKNKFLSSFYYNYGYWYS